MSEPGFNPSKRQRKIVAEIRAAAHEKDKYQLDIKSTSLAFARQFSEAKLMDQVLTYLTFKMFEESEPGIVLSDEEIWAKIQSVIGGEFILDYAVCEFEEALNVKADNLGLPEMEFEDQDALVEFLVSPGARKYLNLNDIPDGEMTDLETEKTDLLDWFMEILEKVFGEKHTALFTEIKKQIYSTNLELRTKDMYYTPWTMIVHVVFANIYNVGQKHYMDFVQDQDLDPEN